MALLHKQKEIFRDAVALASEKSGVTPAAVEKDYYVTLVLQKLFARVDYIVFKGGTSLSKCHKVIKRFSEDIDITISHRLSQGQMKKLKEAIVAVAEELDLNISNLADTRSRRSYNRYILEYNSAIPNLEQRVQTSVLLETSFSEVSYPTIVLPVHSYIGDMMAEEAPEHLKDYCLDLFEVKVQGIDRTLVDKVFAICDYYLQNRVKKHSRHIYDIYKLLPLVSQDDRLKDLIGVVRNERAMTNICPSAQPGVDIPELLKYLVEKEVYRDDYNDTTRWLLEENVPYETAIKTVQLIAESGLFEEERLQIRHTPKFDGPML